MPLTSSPSDAPTSAGLVGPPQPVPNFIVTVRQEANGKGFVVELPYGPVYFFYEAEEMVKFVNQVLAKYL